MYFCLLLVWSTQQLVLGSSLSNSLMKGWSDPFKNEVSCGVVWSLLLFSLGFFYYLFSAKSANQLLSSNSLSLLYVFPSN